MGITIVKSDSGALTAFVEQQTLSVASDHPAYAGIAAALGRGDAAEAIRLSKMSERVANYLRDPSNPNALRIEHGIVFYNGYEVQNTLTNRIVEFLKKGHAVEPLVLFFENLMLNPSRHSVEQLHNFLEHYSLPLTEDGHFLAYKRVRDNWHDFFSNTFDNSVGKKPHMDRNRVDDDWSNDCSYGLHLGSIDFVRNFYSGQGHIILCKVNPRDAVAVPRYTTTKMRVSDYEVLEEVDPETLGLPEALYKADGSNPVSVAVPVNPPQDWETNSVSTSAVDDEDDSEEEEVEEDDSDEEDDSYEDDSSDEDDGDDEDSSDEDEDEDEDDSAVAVPLSLMLWCEHAGVSKSSFSKYFADENDATIRNSWGNQDGIAFVDNLLLAAAKKNDHAMQNVLNDKENCKNLIKLVRNV